MTKITKNSELYSEGCKLLVIAVFSTTPKVLGVRVIDGTLQVGTSLSFLGKPVGMVVNMERDRHACLRAKVDDEVAVKIR